MSTENLSRQRQLVQQIERLRSRIHAVQPPGAWSDIELTMPQFRALNLLMSGTHRMTEVAAALGTSVQATTSLVDRLVEKGLVVREHDTVDRRVVLCRLTPPGREEVERIYRIGQLRLELLADVLTDEELDLAIAAFTTLADAASRLGRGAEHGSQG